METTLCIGFVPLVLLWPVAVALAQKPPDGTPNLAARVNALEAAVADLQNTSSPLELTVDCSAGETVNAALDQVGYRPGWVTIHVHGVCTERVQVRRDRTTIQGASAADGLKSPPDNRLALAIRGRMFTLADLSVRGTISAGMGSSFSITRVTITECASGSGLSVSGNAAGTLDASSIRGCRGGIAVSGGGHLQVWSSVIEENSFMGASVSGGQLDVFPDTAIRNNGSFGLWVEAGGIGVTAGEGESVRIEGGAHGVGVNSGGSFTATGPGVEIRANTNVGVAVMFGSSAVLQGVRVADTSAGPGMFIRGGGSVTLKQGTVVENNASGGVHIQNMGVGDFQGAIIRNNRFNGIGVSTLGLAMFQPYGGPATQILSNQYHGVSCAEPPDVALVAGSHVELSGNGSGDDMHCTRVP